jgi:hypothetical protein
MDSEQEGAAGGIISFLLSAIATYILVHFFL